MKYQLLNFKRIILFVGKKILVYGVVMEQYLLPTVVSGFSTLLHSIVYVYCEEGFKNPKQLPIINSLVTNKSSV